MPEPSIAETIEILKGLKTRFEQHHGVKYAPAALTSAAELAARFINDRHLPDKAIDVIDEAGAAQKILPKSKQKKVIGKAEVEEIVAKIARIPAKNVSSDDRNALKTLDRDLKNVVFGQNKAIDALVSAIRMARSGLGNPRKPIGNFLFSGPTGVGKTEVARQLAYCLGVELIRFDMSEYMERHAVSRLIGAPPGYVGFDQGGQLTEAVTKHPYSVRAARRDREGASGHLQHPAAGDGPRHADRQQRAQGRLPQRDRHHDHQRRRERAGQGLDGLHADEAGGRRDGRDQAHVHAGVPQPAGRDDLVRRRSTTTSSCASSTSSCSSSRTSCTRRRSTPSFTPELKEFLAKKGFDPQMGARPMARLIQDTIRKALADELLFGRLTGGGKVTIDIGADDKVKLVFEETPEEAEPVSCDEKPTCENGARGRRFCFTAFESAAQLRPMLLACCCHVSA